MPLHKLYAKWVQDWDHRIAAIATNRVIRPFEWGAEWSATWPCRNGHCADDPASYFAHHSRRVLENSDDFYRHETPAAFDFDGDWLRFPSNVVSPHTENNTVHARWFPAPGRNAVIVLPHWNALEHAHIGVARMAQKLGINALRLSLPYHDRRMPAELQRADYAVSSNVGRTIDATRQAVLDVRCCVDWLEERGMERIGIVGTSLGSCHAFLASAHEPRLTVNCFNHCSLYFADVVWTGVATSHIRQSLESATTLDDLRQAWLGISPAPYLERFARQPKNSLFIYARYDTSFLPEFSETVIGELRRHGARHQVKVLPCGHYTTGETPYKYIDGWHMGRFLHGAFREPQRRAAGA